MSKRMGSTVNGSWGVRVARGPRTSRPFKPNIKKVNGMWYAYAPNHSVEARAALIPAIGFVRRLNSLADK